MESSSQPRPGPQHIHLPPVALWSIQRCPAYCSRPSVHTYWPPAPSSFPTTSSCELSSPVIVEPVPVSASMHEAASSWTPVITFSSPRANGPFHVSPERILQRTGTRAYRSACHGTIASGNGSPRSSASPTNMLHQQCLAEFSDAHAPTHDCLYKMYSSTVPGWLSLFLTHTHPGTDVCIDVHNAASEFALCALRFHAALPSFFTSLSAFCRLSWPLRWLRSYFLSV
mmetsp:Transcript_11655/g.20292  ORF Transcript_11655/g.20292 Transcript_11655/m.20292 type:complete len:227 (+) Transcript_11655:828-1508(+)